MDQKIDKEQSYLLALISGDKKAYEYFFNTYYSLLVLFSFKIVKRKDVSEDIVQDVFVALWRIKETLSKLIKLKPYLYTSTKNKSISYITTLKNKVMSVVSEDIPEVEDETSLITQEKIEKVNLAISNLPEKCREVFLLIKKEGYSYKEASDYLNISIKTVEAQIYKAMRLLKSSV